MDSNGLRFWLLASPSAWQIDAENKLEFDGGSQRLRLRSELTTLPAPPLQNGEAKTRLDFVPAALDSYGTRAYLDTTDQVVKAVGVLDTPLSLWAVPSGEELTDLVMGYDGVLYLALSGDVLLIDLRERWQPARVHHAALSAWRLAPNADGGVWVLDRDNRRLARLDGLPRADRGLRDYSPEVARPCADDPDPPHLILLDRASIPAGEKPVALATSPLGDLALLTWLEDPAAAPPELADTRLRLLDRRSGELHAPIVLQGARFPYSCAWVDETTLAVMLADHPKEALVYQLRETLARAATDDTARDQLLKVPPLGDYYPLRDHNGTPFLKGPSFPPHYSATILADGSRITSPLYPLSLPNMPQYGWATSAMLIDSASQQTTWHRLYLEAIIPEHCGVKIWLAATPELDTPIAEEDWYEHRFGARYDHESADVPVGTWLPFASELPGQAGMLGCAPERPRSGLFTALIQRPGRRVRALRGRYLRIKIELFGDGRASPEIAGLRAYASRFSYVERYLPELYHESLFPPEADDRGPSTPADFYERFVSLFEGILTPLEDRVAYADLLTDARTTPEDALEWLGSWIGLSFDAGYPAERRRDLLAAAPRLFRLRGTLAGLKLALEIATGGGVSGGEIVILEDFRLRRTFATILGADLAEENDPLLMGLVNSGNSYVGDTLFLGDEATERRKEFLALFRDDLPKSSAEQQAVAALFDRLAHRVTVLVHQEVEPQDLKLIRRVVELETPAHIAVRVLASSYPFLVGMAALVGVDSYLRDKPPALPVALNRSRLGERDYLMRPASLDPRLGGGYRATLGLPSAPPAAEAGENLSVAFAEDFTLDASGSQAAPGKSIEAYIWRMERDA